jgi:hypothetical protein
MTHDLPYTTAYGKIATLFNKFAMILGEHNLSHERPA